MGCPVDKERDTQADMWGSWSPDSISFTGTWFCTA